MISPRKESSIKKKRNLERTLGTYRCISSICGLLRMQVWERMSGVFKTQQRVQNLLINTKHLERLKEKSISFVFGSLVFNMVLVVETTISNKILCEITM